MTRKSCKTSDIIASTKYMFFQNLDVRGLQPGSRPFHLGVPLNWPQSYRQKQKIRSVGRTESTENLYPIKAGHLIWGPTNISIALCPDNISPASKKNIGHKNNKEEKSRLLTRPIGNTRAWKTVSLSFCHLLRKGWLSATTRRKMCSNVQVEK